MEPPVFYEVLFLLENRPLCISQSRLGSGKALDHCFLPMCYEAWRVSTAITIRCAKETNAVAVLTQCKAKGWDFVKAYLALL